MHRTISSFVSAFLVLLTLVGATRVSADTWSLAATPPKGRIFGSAVQLDNGKVLVVGGFDITHQLFDFYDAYLYDPSTNTWSQTGDIKTPRVSSPLVKLQNGQALFIGRASELGQRYPGQTPYPLPASELYDVASGTWIDQGETFLREAPRAAVLPSGQVLVAGGYAHTRTPPASSWLYTSTSLTTGTWTATDSLNLHFDRAGHTATTLTTGEVLIVGGANTWTFQDYGTCESLGGSWDAGSWHAFTWYSFAGDLRTARSNHVTVPYNTGVLVIGGKAYGSGNPVNTMEYVDHTNGIILAAPTLRYRQYHTATVLHDGRILLIGGTDTNDVSTGQTEIYTPWTGTWAFGPTMHYPRSGHTATLLSDGRVLVADGSSDTTNVPAEIFTP
jgi:hypothetical protein